MSFPFSFMDAGRLYSIVAATGYPVDPAACKVGDRNDRSTWTYPPLAGQTPTAQQISDAAAAVANWQPNATLDQQTDAKAMLDPTSLDQLSRLQRGIILATANDLKSVHQAVNTLSAALTTLITAITANGATLTTIKTAAQTISLPLPTLPDVTQASVTTAIRNAVDGNA